MAREMDGKGIKITFFFSYFIIYLWMMMSMVFQDEKTQISSICSVIKTIEICGCCENGGDCYCPPQDDCRKTCPKCSVK